MIEEITKECPLCEGTGSALPEGCENCDSNGWVYDPSDGGTETCPECLGDSGEECPDCEGEGMLDGISRGQVWCLHCKSTQKVNGAECLTSGWPKCCGYTMTIDSPEEQIALEATND